jgi:hypothetical protein
MFEVVGEMTKRMIEYLIIPLENMELYLIDTALGFQA